jgi:hypothetical protein
MRLLALFTVVCLCSNPALAQLGNQLTGNSQAQNLPPENKKGSAKAAPSNLQLEFRVPFDPTVFASGSHSYLVYEIHLTNFMPAPLSLSRIEVLDADAEEASSVLSNKLSLGTRFCESASSPWKM